ncbi:MAG: hypothetical protein IT373_21290, partial [Polyangiaceae bacterium]|nr:hypothetical protein [Polyangiaceae bacterium]
MRIVEDAPGERLVLGGGPFGWRRLAFDRRAVVGRPGLFAWRRLRRLELPASELRAPRLCLRRGARGAPFSVELHAGPDVLDFPVEHLDSRQEALDLLHRLAAALGFDRYELLRKDDDGIEVELHREGERDPFRSALGEPVLVPAGGADYRPVAALQQEVSAAPARPGRFTEPATPPPPFAPTTTYDGARVVEWRPGERVVLSRSARHPVLALLFLLFVAPFYVLFGSALIAAMSLTAGMVIIIPLAVLADQLGAKASHIGGIAFLVLFVGTWVVGGLALGWDVLRRFRWMLARETILDWQAGTATFRLWRVKRVFRLAEIRGLTVLENSGSEKTKKKKKYWEWCELEIRLPGLDEVVLKTDRHRTAG